MGFYVMIDLDSALSEIESNLERESFSIKSNLRILVPGSSGCSQSIFSFTFLFDLAILLSLEFSASPGGLPPHTAIAILA